MPYIESVVTSEMLLKRQKTLEQLGIPIINEYGASELDLIAFQPETQKQRGWKSIQKLYLLKF
jgi:phenylacetate-CoA ligase